MALRGDAPYLGAPFDAGSGAGSSLALDATGRSAIVVPGGEFALQASYERRGDDLVLSGADGRVVVVRDFFVQAEAPELVTSDGHRVAGDLVEALAREARRRSGAWTS